MSVSRRSVLLSAAGAAALPLVHISRAQAADYVLKCSLSIAATHPLAIRLTEASKRIAEQSNGKIDLQVYPSAQLGGDVDVLSQTRSGAVQLQCIGGTTAAVMVPIAAINGVGFAFADYDKVWAAMDGDVGKAVVAAYNKSGFFALPRIFDNGFRQLTTSTKEVKTVADVKGLKLRVPAAQIWVSLWKALGASPTMLDLSEVYSALQTKIVEGQENGVQLIETSKFYEVQKHCALTNHQWDGWWMLGHKATIDGLPDTQKEVLLKNLDQAVTEERADIRDSTDGTIKKLTGLGLAFNDIDLASFRNQLKSTTYYKDWQAKFGDAAWNTLQNYTGPLS